MSEVSYVQARRLRVDGATVERIFTRQQWDGLPASKGGFEAINEFKADPEVMGEDEGEVVLRAAAMPQQTQAQSDWAFAKVLLHAYDQAEADIRAILRAAPDKAAKLDAVQLFIDKVDFAQRRIKLYLSESEDNAEKADPFPDDFWTDGVKRLPPDVSRKLKLQKAANELLNLGTRLERLRRSYEALPDQQANPVPVAPAAPTPAPVEAPPTAHTRLAEATPEPAARKKRGKNPEPEFSSFDDLFFDKGDIPVCINALREIDPPMISDKGNWIGGRGSKSVLVQWIEVLETRGKIPHISKPKLVPLLVKHFKGLSLSEEGSSFRKITGVKNYKPEFLSIIPK